MNFKPRGSEYVDYSVFTFCQPRTIVFFCSSVICWETGPDLDMRAAFSSGAVEAHPTLEYQKIKGDKRYMEAPWAAFSSGTVKAHPILEYQIYFFIQLFC